MLSRYLNQSLETLRNSVLNRRARSLEVIVPEESICKRVHSGFLFTTGSGRKILQEIELFLADTPDGWEDFADAVGLCVVKIKAIRNRFITAPVYNCILAQTQTKDFSFYQILRSLKEIGRRDVVANVSPKLHELARQITEEHPHIEGLITPFQDHQSLTKALPFILADYEQETASQNCDPDISSCIRVQEKIPKLLDTDRKPYTKLLFVTHVDDGAEIVEELSMKLANTSIGILNLEHNRQMVLSAPEHTILQWCNQADYIVPILSKDYVRDLRDNFKYDNQDFSQNLNTKYAGLIYRQMYCTFARTNYTVNKVRCIIPNDSLAVLEDSMLNSPLFQIWFTETNVEKLIQSMIASIEFE